jgi:separase
LRTSALDTLFSLSRNILDTSNADTYILAYTMLERATKLARSKSSSDSLLSNHLRSVSAAFYAIGGSLYQAGRGGAAVRFIQGACTLGEEAVTLWRQHLDTADLQADQEVWIHLVNHLYKRWELLGVCHSKMADRLVGHFRSL